MLQAPRKASTTEVPILDLSSWLAGGPPDELVAQMRAACQGTGFFYVAGHGVPEEVISGIFDATRFPYREELAAHYADYTGRSVEHLDYYVVLAIFKLAAIMEGHVARAVAGKSDPSRAQNHREFVDRITAKAVEIAQG